MDGFQFYAHSYKNEILVYWNIKFEKVNGIRKIHCNEKDHFTKESDFKIHSMEKKKKKKKKSL